MAKSSARRRYVPPADQPSGTTPTVTVTAACEAHRHARCRGEVISLFYQGPCECSCHALPVPQAWKGEAA